MVVCGKRQGPAAQRAVGCVQELRGGVSGSLRIASLIGAAAYPDILAGRIGHELPQAEGARMGSCARVVGGFDMGQVDQKWW